MLNVNKRQNKLLNILKAERATTAREIADQLNVSTRTIRSDIQFLKQHFYQIRTRSGRYGGGTFWIE